MKITISPTEDQRGEKYAFHTVSIKTISDEIKVDEAVGILHTLLVAWGFSSQSVQKEMNEFIQ